jgi:hypothetical protein
LTHGQRLLTAAKSDLPVEDFKTQVAMRSSDWSPRNSVAPFGRFPLSDSTGDQFVERERGSAALLCIVVGLTLGWTALAASIQLGPTTAEDIVASLMQPAVGTSVAAWKARAPAATWRRYRGTLEDIVVHEPEPPGIDPGGFWCATAMDRPEAVERVVVFYGLRNTSPPACRAELIYGVMRRGTEADAATLFQNLSRAMTQRLGVSATAVDVKGRDTPVPYGGGTGYPEGVAPWEAGVRWPVDERDVFLFRAPRAVGFTLRSRLLTRDAEEEGGPDDVAGEAERRLAEALRERFPAAAAAMPFDFIPQHQAEIRRGLIQVLDAHGGATAEDTALLTLAADRLARKLWIEPPSPSEHREFAPLLRRGLRFVNDGHEDLWKYDGAFVSVILRKWPETPWGQLAFVTRLEGGWTEGCDEYAFRQVIRQGDAWLRSHPESPWRIAVLTTVARAYETKWALNGLFTVDGRENARLVTAAEASARVRAMRLYDEVMRLAPQSKDAAYARRRIIQIRANMTTSQDAYSCVIP